MFIPVLLFVVAGAISEGRHTSVILLCFFKPPLAACVIGQSCTNGVCEASPKSLPTCRCNSGFTQHGDFIADDAGGCVYRTMFVGSVWWLVSGFVAAGVCIAVWRLMGFVRIIRQQVMRGEAQIFGFSPPFIACSLAHLFHSGVMCVLVLLLCFRAWL